MQQTVIPAQPQAYVAPAGQPGMAYPPNTTVIIQTVPDTYQQASLSYAKKQSQALGIVQIACGIVSILFNIILIAIQPNCFTVAHIGYGIWCGVFYLISGGLGLGAAKNPSYCMLVSHMVMSIISACFTAVHLSMAGIGVALSSDDYYCYDRRSDNSATNLGMSLTLVVIALAEAVTAIWASAICCSAMCCRNGPQAGTVLYGGQQQYATTVANPGQVVYQQPQMQGQQPQMQGQQPQMQGQQPQMQGQPPQMQGQQPQMQGQQQQYAYPQPQYVQNVAAVHQAAPAYAAQPPVYTEK